MTDRIDLDELAEEAEEPDEERDANPGDWLWRDDAGTEPAADSGRPEPSTAQSDGASTAQSDGTSPDGTADASTTSGPDAPMPHVPRENKDRPVGIPKESGGAGGAAAPDQEQDRTETPEAEGPHGGGADDMTMALTYRAARQLANPAAVFADAAQWADWVGIVGDVDAHVINKFQRDHHVDADFFNGSGTGPGERLAGIDSHSMFFADRMVVVGVDGDEWIADESGWEFVPLAEAAEKADWEVVADAR